MVVAGLMQQQREMLREQREHDARVRRELETQAERRNAECHLRSEFIILRIILTCEIVR